MPTELVMRERVAEAVEELEGNLAKAEMTEEDRARNKELRGIITSGKEDIASVEFAKGERKVLDTVQDVVIPKDTPGTPDTATATPGGEMRVLPQFEEDFKREKPGQKLYLPARVRARHALRAFDDTYEGEQLAFLFCHWLMGSTDKPTAQTVRSQELCKSMGMEHRYIEDRAQSEGIATTGGYLVPDQFEPTIIRIVEDQGVARRECRIVQLTGDIYDQPRSTGRATVTFTGEAVALSETTPTYDRVRLAAQKLGALLKISSEVNEDAAISIADDILLEVALGFAAKEDDCLFNGTGTSGFGGMTGITQKMIDGNHDGSRIEMTAGIDTPAEYTDALIVEAMGATPQLSAAGEEKWYCSKPFAFAAFYRLVRAAGANTVGELVAGVPATYMGAPIIMSPKMPKTLTAVDSIIGMFFGDMRAAVSFGDRRGITVKVLMELYAETDQIGITATERFDINYHEAGDGSTAGPLVGLLHNTS